LEVSLTFCPGKRKSTKAEDTLKKRFKPCGVLMGHGKVLAFSLSCCIDVEGDLSWETILEVGCEGGSVKLLGENRGACWRFKMNTNETSMRVLVRNEDLPGELESTSKIVSSWDEALFLLDKYPNWPRLHPI